MRWQVHRDVEYLAVVVVVVVVGGSALTHPRAAQDVMNEEIFACKLRREEKVRWRKKGRPQREFITTS